LISLNNSQTVGVEKTLSSGKKYFPSLKCIEIEGFITATIFQLLIHTITIVVTTRPNACKCAEYGEN